MSTCDVEVVEVAAANSLLPNLTICVDGDEEGHEVLEIEYANDEKNKEAGEKEADDDDSVKPDIKLKNSFPRQRLYENTQLGDLASLGLSFEEAKAKREERAKRFTSPLVDLKTKEISKDDEAKCVERAAIQEEIVAEHNENLDGSDADYIRTDALHLHGVSSMSTKEIFCYCGSTYPSHIEWINDVSCNIIWKESGKAALALEKLAHPYQHRSTTVSVSIPPSRNKSTESKTVNNDDDMDDLDLMGEHEEKMDTSLEDGEIATMKGHISAEQQVNPMRRCIEPFVRDSDKIHLKLRFATSMDKKVLGAAKKSRYYQEHGNPHYGGVKGVLSASYRRRYQRKRTHIELKNMNIETSHDQMEKRRKRFEDGEKEQVETVPLDQDAKELQAEDQNLIKTSAKDLQGAVKIEESDESSEDEELQSMRADLLEKHIKAARRSAGSEMRITTINTSIHSRLGRSTVKSQPKQTKPMYSEIEEYSPTKSKTSERAKDSHVHSRLGSKSARKSPSRPTKTMYSEIGDWSKSVKSSVTSVASDKDKATESPRRDGGGDLRERLKKRRDEKSRY